MIYNRSDRKVLLAISIIATIAIGGMMLFSGNIKISFSKTGDFDVAASKENSKQNYTRRYQSYKTEYSDDHYYDDIKPRQLRLVAFDPNTADAQTLEGLGLARWQVKSILKYRAKGGMFRKPEDFARVYKLTAKQYKQIRPYIRISSDYQPASNLVEDNAKIVESDIDNFKKYSKIGKGEYITLNDADTSALRHVPGIGPYFANEIKNYERRLGGYVDVDQLSEIEHFPEETKTYFQIDLSKVKKMNVNKLSLSKLREHPYINYYQARDIVDYRHKYGNLKSIDELKLSPHFSAEDLARIRPYLEY